MTEFKPTNSQQFLSKKLPVFAALNHSLNLTLDNIRVAVRFSWAWFMIWIAYLIVAGVIAWSNGYASAANVLWPLTLLAILAAVSIAVVWHRYILLDEADRQTYNLRIDAVVWRYLGNLILIFLALVIVAVPIGVLLSLVGARSALIVVMVFLLPLFYRLAVKLPAIALEKYFTFTDAINCTIDNYWRLLGLSIFILLASLLIELINKFFIVIGTSFGSPGVIVFSCVVIALQALFALFNISVLTTLYGFFVEGREFED